MTSYILYIKCSILLQYITNILKIIVYIKINYFYSSKYTYIHIIYNVLVLNNYFTYILSVKKDGRETRHY